MQAVIEDSHRIIIFLTSNFIRDEWNMLALSKVKEMHISSFLVVKSSYLNWRSFLMEVNLFKTTDYDSKPKSIFSLN